MIEDEVYEIIKKLQQERRDSGRAPWSITRMELQRQINAALNGLYLTGRIKAGETINDKYIEVI